MSTLTLQQPGDQIRGLIRNPWVKGILIALAVSLLALFLADSAHAAATGASDFNTLYDRLRGWCGGSLGKALSLGFLVVGLAGGLIRGSIVAAVVATGAALALAVMPDLIDSLFTAGV